MKVLSLLIVTVLLCCTFPPAFALGESEQPLSGFVGNLLRRPARAPDFTLIDQHGAPFHMATTKGKVVLMTFIYTHCEDTCPFLAIKVKDAHDFLGPDAANVVIVAVTTDPNRDTPQVAAAHSRELGLFDQWYFVGDPRERSTLCGLTME